MGECGKMQSSQLGQRHTENLARVCSGRGANSPENLLLACVLIKSSAV